MYNDERQEIIFLSFFFSRAWALPQPDSPYLTWSYWQGRITQPGCQSVRLRRWNRYHQEALWVSLTGTRWRTSLLMFIDGPMATSILWISHTFLPRTIVILWLHGLFSCNIDHYANCDKLKYFLQDFNEQLLSFKQNPSICDYFILQEVVPFIQGSLLHNFTKCELLVISAFQNAYHEFHENLSFRHIWFHEKLILWY